MKLSMKLTNSLETSLMEVSKSVSFAPYEKPVPTGLSIIKGACIHIEVSIVSLGGLSDSEWSILNEETLGRGPSRLSLNPYN